MIRFEAMLEKLADGISTQQAEDALRRLRDLESSKLTKGQLVRGAGLGAVAGPAVGALGRLISGGPKRTLTNVGRDVASQAVTGAAMGGGLPFVRHKLDAEAETRKLKEYLGYKPKSQLGQRIEKTLGV